jgi:YggT family protein
MFVIATIVATLCYAMLTLILVRVVFSWISRDVDNPIYKITYAVTEPVMGPVRKLVPANVTAGLDLSPAIVAIGFFILIALANRFY